VQNKSKHIRVGSNDKAIVVHFNIINTGIQV
jgi:hypothetical protein